jgi:predicted AAA+ superfamily ATPase
MIPRDSYRDSITRALTRAPICYLAGPRQVGKTTLARTFLPESSDHYFDLEDPLAMRRLEEPMTALSSLDRLVVIDEIQRSPELFPALRVLVDRNPSRRFLILGSAAPSIVGAITESLAGRVERVSLPGFGREEVGNAAMDRLWLRGGFPRSFLAESDEDSYAWRAEFMLGIAERDLPQTGLRAPGRTLMRFWTMLAHAQGNVWNAADPARSLGLSETTVRKYLDAWEGLFMVRVLGPWHEKISKRQVKSPKVYVRDAGLFHSLLGIRNGEELLGHPKSGASWESFVIEELYRVLKPDEAYFWATHSGAELDFLAIKNGGRYGFEIKRADAPRLTQSMRIAIEELKLDRLWVIYPGLHEYPLGERALAFPFDRLGELGSIGDSTSA